MAILLKIQGVQHVPRDIMAHRTRPFHGGNTGSIPVGRANDLKSLAPKLSLSRPDAPNNALEYVEGLGGMQGHAPSGVTVH